MIDYLGIIKKYYTEGSDAYNLLVKHSTQVADLCMTLAGHTSVEIDKIFTYEAAMLHDIGMFLTDAPPIFCFGDKPYICHGVLGRELMDSLGYPRHALVCERHTGTGLACDEVIAQNLPLPHRDMLPVSNEEKLVCYADNFFSKSKISDAKSPDEVRSQLKKYGEGTMSRFEALYRMFPFK